MTTLNLCPVVVAICLTRGDSTPFGFRMQDAEGVDLTITGNSYLLSVNTEEEPANDDNQVFQLVGNVASPVVTFSPSTAQTGALVPGTPYFYDVQETTAGGNVRTVIKGGIEVRQDITK